MYLLTPGLTDPFEDEVPSTSSTFNSVIKERVPSNRSLLTTNVVSRTEMNNSYSSLFFFLEFKIEIECLAWTGNAFTCSRDGDDFHFLLGLSRNGIKRMTVLAHYVDG